MSLAAGVCQCQVTVLFRALRHHLQRLQNTTVCRFVEHEKIFFQTGKGIALAQ